MKTSTRFRAGLEALDRRDVPSTVVLAPPKPIHLILPLGTVGAGYVTGTTLATGGVRALTSQVSGRCLALGQFEGQVVASGSGHSIAVLTGVNNGQQLRLDIDGAFTDLPPVASRVSGHFRFRVAGGTGTFAGATGAGKISGSFDPSTGNLAFVIHGRVSTWSGPTQPTPVSVGSVQSDHRSGI
jgi:hypothetical protein